jgi:hypothetical protein
VSKNRFPKLPHPQDDDEKHSSDVCFKYFSAHLRVEVETKGHERVGCPRRVGNPKACIKLHLSGVCPRCSFRLWLPADRKVIRYLDRAAKKCMQEEKVYHACPNAGYSWGSHLTIAADIDQYSDNKV